MESQHGLSGVEVQSPPARRHRQTLTTIFEVVKEVPVVIFFLILVTICLLLTATIIIVTISNKHVPSDHKNAHVLEEVQSLIKSRFDPDIDPCLDFYKFSCGKVLSAQDKVMSAQDELRTDLFNQMKDILEDTVISTSQAVNKAKQLYSTCMATTVNVNESKQTEEIASILNYTLIGQWPILYGQDWNESEYDLENILVQLFTYNVPSIIELGFQADSNDSTKQHVLFKPVNTGSTESSDIDGVLYSLKILKTVAFLKSSNLRELDNSVSQAAKLIFQFERKLTDVVTASNCTHDRQKSFTDKTTEVYVDDISLNVPEIDWTSLIEQVLHALPLPLPPSLNTTDTIMGLYCPEVLFKVLNVITTTPNRTVADYFIWRFAHKFTPFMGQSFQQSPFAIPGWAKCVSVVNSGFSFALANAYLEKHHDVIGGTDTVENIIFYLKAAFQQIISEQRWTSEEFKDKLVEKLKSIQVNVGYPSFVLGAECLDEYYGNFKLHENSYFLSGMELNKFHYGSTLSMIWDGQKQEHDVRIWQIKPLLHTNSFTIGNSIVVPLGILKSPFFNKTQPMYLNFAMLGSIIGHEIAHGFDLSHGGLLNAEVASGSWWPETERQLYMGKVKCFVEQYGDVKVPLLKKNIDGNKTLDENLSDNIGFRMTMKAYELWKDDNKDVMQPTMPGPLVNYTVNQLFYMAYSQLRCEAMEKQKLQKYLRASHSPGQFRVNGVIQNNLDFGKIFNCCVGSPMNPASKCSVWE